MVQLIIREIDKDTNEGETISNQIFESMETALKFIDNLDSKLIEIYYKHTYILRNL